MLLFKIIFLTVSVTFGISIVSALELKGLQFLVQLISGDFMDSKKKSQAKSPKDINRGFCRNSFVDYISKRQICFPDDDLLVDLEPKLDKGRKSVKCLPYEGGNGTLLMLDSIKDLALMLQPNGNSTKRTEAGNCALVLFYTKSCPGSAMVAPHFNALPRQFPDLKIATIDALKHYSLNSEFGIIGLPTVMIFHQGRPLVKYNETTYSVKNFIKFIHRYTNLEAINNAAYVTSDDFNGPLNMSGTFDHERDIWLWISWLFIIVCACYYFSQSRFYNQIVEMIKRTWRESEAQHEHQN
ncbi:thioredoxin domain-containing protein 15 [Culicoides brevitarsis]|uniref:thioredoxin domain-containing protein 15 n=1 Tax=Culicoides brevitarsis TaxID=469753 RepID=UPI00307B7063